MDIPRTRIEKYLQENNISVVCDGFTYLTDIIAQTCFEDKPAELQICNLYHDVANKYDKTHAAIERASRYAIIRAEHNKTVKEFVLNAYYYFRQLN